MFPDSALILCDDNLPCWYSIILSPRNIQNKSFSMNMVCKVMQSIWPIIKVMNKYQRIHLEKHVKFQVFCIITHIALWVNSDKTCCLKVLVGTHLTTLYHSPKLTVSNVTTTKTKNIIMNQETVLCIVHFNNTTNTFSLKLNILPTETAWSPRYED